uniref:Uncharacterized protein n=1 Tax=Kalanchoe fedtschenkoi TaxID=63787 RepID=A0A7N0VCR8_KALFE
MFFIFSNLILLYKLWYIHLLKLINVRNNFLKCISLTVSPLDLLGIFIHTFVFADPIEIPLASSSRLVGFLWC